MYFPRLTFSFTASSTVVSKILNLSGLAKDINWEVETFDLIARIPDWTNAITTAISLVNQSGLTIWSITGLADPQLAPPFCIPLQRKIKKGSYITVTLSGAAGGSGGDVTIDLSVK